MTPLEIFLITEDLENILKDKWEKKAFENDDTKSSKRRVLVAHFSFNMYLVELLEFLIAVMFVN